MRTLDLARSRSGDSPIKVLVVDDDPVHRLIAEELLMPPRYEVRLADDGAAGLRVLQQEDIDVVVLDRQMPGMLGDEFCRRVRGELGMALLPILMATGSSTVIELNGAFEAGADDILRKPYLPSELLARVDSAALRKRLAQQVDHAESALLAIARMVSMRCTYGGDHCTRLTSAAMRLGQALALPLPDRVALRRGSVLHDIGTLGIPDAILDKPGPLSDREWEAVRRHADIGHQLVAHIAGLRQAALIVRHHHERWDGSGYPDGLAGEQIPFLARVFQLVDIHDALTSERPHRPAMTASQASDVLLAEAERGWRDPALTRTFVQTCAEWPAGATPVPA